MILGSENNVVEHLDLHAGKKPFTYIGLETGIASEVVAWTPLEWECRGVRHANAFAGAVVKKNWPHVEQLNTKTLVLKNHVNATDLIFSRAKPEPFSIADFSVGVHAVFDHPIIGLLGDVERLAARWLVWEGYASVLQDENRAFETLLQGLAKCGFGFAYRVLDAQHFGSPQKHRRLYLVAHAGGDWQRCAGVLFDAESLHRDCPTCWETEDEDQLDSDLGTVETGDGKKIHAPRYAATLRPGGAGRKSHSKLTGGSSRTTLIVEENPQWTPPVGVRRLTPLEYERIMGLPDNYTFLPINTFEPDKDETLADLRYEAVGGAVPAQVLRWLGERIKIMDAI